MFGNSRWGAAVFASEEDKDRLDSIFAVLFPDSDRNAIDSTSKKHKLRDAMHIATSIRYGYDVFVTTDTGLLNRAVWPYGENGASRSCARARRSGGWKTGSNGNELERNPLLSPLIERREPPAT